MSKEPRKRIARLLVSMYGSPTGEQIGQALQERLEQFKRAHPNHVRADRELFHQGDIILITYGDILQDETHPPLENLRRFYQERLQPNINTIHILPFFPYSSDDGFSIIDYKAVNPQLGSWDEIEQLKQAGSRLMFDAVINHISSQSEWFQRFLAGDLHYHEYFITVDPEKDLSLVTRPRSLPLLTPFETAEGTQYVWTTFSADQVDLNFADPDTLLDVLDVILFYIARGADLIRLDAIAYLWKEIGTTCIHLPQTHAFVKLLRAIVDEISPELLLLTETNVPHQENISYFGDGSDEAHLVYQFSLPPLTAHAILTGSAIYLRVWAKSLTFPSVETNFFNFTASHDGVGVRPLTGIMPDEEIAILLDTTLAHGGRISSKTNQDGSTSPYELNINYFDLLNDPNAAEAQSLQVDRFMASQAIMLMLKGIPGIYFHSLVGSRNDLQGVVASGHARAINRKKLQMDPLMDELLDSASLRHEVFHKYMALLEIRTREAAFHPVGNQQVLDLPSSVFGVLRTAPDGTEQIVAIQNITAQAQQIGLSLEALPTTSGQPWHEIISDTEVSAANGQLALSLAPYQTIWLKQSIH
ncbi:sugar phosphorylase [bacterium]|nr:sugar phosphorylase [bacterium]